jgi:hypothetical protein
VILLLALLKAIVIQKLRCSLLGYDATLCQKFDINRIFTELFGRTRRLGCLRVVRIQDIDYNRG